jgi:hypothetical protein
MERPGSFWLCTRIGELSDGDPALGYHPYPKET